MKQLLAALMLAGLWMLLFGRFDWYTFGLGLLVGGAAIAYCRPLVDPDRRRRPTRIHLRSAIGLVRRVWSFFRLIWLYAFELIKTNLMMARDVLQPSTPKLSSAIFALEVPGLGPAGTTLLANLITLTPGSLVLDYDEPNETLYIHTIYAEDVEQMKRDYRRFARQIFRVIGREPTAAVIEANR